MVHLSNRLKRAFDLIERKYTVLDIGADRGYLALALAERCQKVYASENKKGPYKALLENTAKADKKYLQILFADGLSLLPDDVDLVSILGMGGKTICKIINDSRDKLGQIKSFLLSPQSDVKDVLTLMAELGFKNTGGLYVFETHYYPILLFKRGETCQNLAALQFGEYPLLNRDKELREYLEAEERRITSLNEIGISKNSLLLQAIRKGLEYYGIDETIEKNLS